MSADTLLEYLDWHWAQVETGDIDPMYPVLRALAERWDLDAEQRAWLCTLHVAWYHCGSTFVAFRAVPSIDALPRDVEGLERAGLLDLPCNTERRGHRNPVSLAKHLLDLPRAMPDGVNDWAIHAVADAATPEHAWLKLNDRLTTVHGNGRWAAYKQAELWQKVAGLPVKAANAGHRFSSGPRKGLALLFPTLPAPEDNSAAAINELDRATQVLAKAALEPDIAQIETSLCDYNSLIKGRYYLGHDIDSMQGDFLHARVRQQIPLAAWEARADVFEHSMLGEYNDWFGVRPEMRGVKP